MPESFEWLILKSGIVSDSDISKLLEHPEDYIESKEFFSWERYFTQLLEERTRAERYKQYLKDHLSDFYLTEANVKKIYDVMPEEFVDYAGINYDGKKDEKKDARKEQSSEP